MARHTLPAGIRSGRPVDKKYMDPAEFQELGYLQELNRRFLHPLGLALEVGTDPSGAVHIWRVQDSRDDPEGMLFEELGGPDDERKRAHVRDEWHRREEIRTAAFGSMIQPFDTEITEAKP